MNREVYREVSRLPAHPSSAAEARALVRRLLGHGQREDLSDSAELAISEVVTNAIVHAGTALEVRIEIDADGLHVEVIDGSAHLPATRNYAELAGTGRGLRMLEQLVDAWGVRPAGDGKVVWFRMGGAAGHAERVAMHVGAEPADQGGDAPVRTESDAVDVVLVNVPLLLHAAWQLHAESLLREYLLSRLDVENAGDEIEAHAAANDAMALLRELVPTPDPGDDPEALMATAVEPLVSRDRLVVRIPRASVDNFNLLNEALEAAVGLADAGAFLTAPTQPELRMLRRWLCTEVVAQSQGSPPTAWASRSHALSPPRTAVTWDDSRVTGADHPVVAADDTNRIVAVSLPTLELLGYADVSELLGRRLVTLIPDRFHQAHLAGFTLHFSTGRAPLIGGTVTVPALCADGSERLVDLSITAERAGRGRWVFVGEMRPTDPA